MTHSTAHRPLLISWILTAALVMTLGTGCKPGTVAGQAGNTGGSGDNAGGDAGSGGDPNGGDGDAGPVTLEWGTIPNVTLTVDIPASVNLRAYLDDPTGGSATITLDNALPDGLSLSNGTITGTPTTVTAASAFVATANDGTSPPAVSASFTIDVIAATINLGFERATPEQIGIYIPLSVAYPDDTTATVRYRESGQSTWLTAHPLLRIHPEWNDSSAPVTPVDAFAGTVFDLTPGTAYDVEVTVTPPAASAIVSQTVVSTRALPAPSGAANVLATTSDNMQTVFDGLVPGDVLELAAGTYNVSGLQVQVSGTESQPITIRGADRAGVVLQNDGTIIQFLEAAHVIIENMTLQGSGVDSGTSASSTAFSFWDGAYQEFITFRYLTITGVDKGIIGWGKIDSILVYECDLTGNNVWDQASIETNATWNDDGIRLPGEGNCAFNNTLHGFGDALAVNNGVMSAAVYFYRNKITMTGDDAIEADYGTRNMALYDCHITNSGTFISFDPLWGGPFYGFRNISINTIRGPFKWNDIQSGYVIYNNTIVRTDGTTAWGWVQYSNGPLRNWSFRNNLMVYQGVGSLMALESGGMDPIDFTHNGWYPDGSIWWSNSGGSYSDLASAYAGLPATTPVFGQSTQRHDNDVITESNPFAAAITLGADHLTEITTFYTPTLASGSVTKNAGTPIPNITDGYAGAAPDMGAVITGRALPTYGATP